MSAEHDINLVTSQASTTVVENLKVTLGTAGAASLTPSTITAMVGIANNSALQVSADVQEAMSKLSAQAAILYPNAAGYIPGVSGPGGSAESALAALTSAQNDLGFGSSPNHGAFGSILNQAKNHISDSVDLKNATNFISNTSFEDLGSGITNFSSMTTQGLNTTFGSLEGAAVAMSAAGPCFDTADMANFGSGAGFVNKLSSVKLANFSGVNEQLAANGVNLDDLSNPVYADTIQNTLNNITDPSAIATIKDQLDLNNLSSISNLNDFTNLNKLTSDPAQLSGFTGGLAGMSEKFKDLGASFPNPAAATDMLKNITVPSIPSLDAVPSMSTLMEGLSPQIDNLIGAGSGEMGVPNMTDFLESVGGGPSIDALNNEINADTVSAITASVNKSSQLFANAGVDFSAPVPNTLGTAMNFATSLHNLGQDSEVSGLLSNMAVSGSQFGDSIKASLAEGKNRALMLANGIRPLNFKG